MDSVQTVSKQIRVSPSILSADFTKIGSEVRKIERANADSVHLDVMDGHFVPNISFGPKMVADIRRVTFLPLDVHLMITDVETYLPKFLEAGADTLTFHLEAVENPQPVLQKIIAAGVKCSLAVSPDTDIQCLEPFLPLCDMVVLMSVFPGFSGQHFLDRSLERLAALKNLRDRISPRTAIEVDGGITVNNFQAVKDYGADILVAGNAFFKAKDAARFVKELKAMG